MTRYLSTLLASLRTPSWSSHLCSHSLPSLRAPAARRTLLSTRSLSLKKARAAHSKQRRAKKPPREKREDLHPHLQPPSGTESMASYMQVLGGTADTGAALYLFEANSRYLFNCFEGMQRFDIDHRIRHNKTADIFLTRIAWDTVGGLAGYLLTTEASRQKKQTIHSAGRIDTLLASAQPFCFLKYTTTQVYRDDSFSFDDGVLNLQGFVTRLAPFNEMAGSPMSQPRAKRARMTDLTSDHMVSYFGYLAQPLGRFDIAKAKALGLKPGPIFANLKNGQPVQAPDGTTVTPEQVLVKLPPNPAFAIVDVRTSEDLGALLQDPRVAHAFAQAGRGGHVFHLTTLALFETQTYHSLMLMFGPHATHVLVDPTLDRRVAYPACYASQCMLNLIDPVVFPRLEGVSRDEAPPTLPSSFTESTTPAVYGSMLSFYGLSIKDDERIAHSKKKKQAKVAAQQKNPAIVKTAPPKASAEPAIRRAIGPQAQHPGTSVPAWTRIRDEDMIVVAKSIPRFDELLDKSTPEANSTSEPVITFLGTGSAIPCKYRNVTGMVLSLPRAEGNAHLVLDCGEATVQQLMRMYDHGDVTRLLQEIEFVHISHTHADHHLGLVGLLHARKQHVAQNRYRPIFILGPHSICDWIMAFGFMPDHDFVFVNNQTLLCTRADKGQEDTKPIHTHLGTLGITELETIPVNHCRDATGLVIQHASGWKFVWSGDTRPCPLIAKIAQDADLLLHEATFEEQMQEDALAKRHSTTKEALSICSQANAKAVILTHFSQRYPRIPQLPTDKTSYPVMIAFDSMRCSFGDVARVQRHLPLLDHLFETLYDCAEGDGEEDDVRGNIAF